MTVIFDPLYPSQYRRALTALESGFAVGLATETVYGLAGLALNEKALSRIFSLKNRPTFDPLIVHVLKEESFWAPLVQSVHPLQRLLMEAFWPGPLSILFEKTERIPDLCTAATPWVALRAPAHPLFQALLKDLGQPLAAPSANRFGQISPTSAEDVVAELGPYGLEVVLDGGHCQHGLESTVVKVVTESTPYLEILRLGAIPVEEISKVLGSEVAIRIRESGSGIDAKFESPGLLKSHYAPRTPLVFWHALSPSEQALVRTESNNFAFLEVYPSPERLAEMPWKAQQTLSSKHDDQQAASLLFSALRTLDQKLAKAIVVIEAPGLPNGLNPAINDRLRRASSSISLTR